MLNLLYPLAMMQAATAQAPEPTPSPAPSPCQSEVHAGFDLWVGQWDVFPSGRDTQVATSTIEKLSAGCAIRETWLPFQGAGGTSISMVNHNTGRWEQTWIGSDGHRVDFEGGVVDGKMVITSYWDNVAGPDKDALVRMTYSRAEEGSVRQFGEASTDHGISWQPFFDFIYRPRDPDTP